MKIVAMLNTYNEEIFIDDILAHYHKHGVYVYILDNESTDSTVKRAKRFLDKNLIGIQTVPRSDKKECFKMLRLKEDLASELDADWFIHADPDEFRLPPTSDITLAEAIKKVDEQGYNVINFMEYTFVPTEQDPSHANDFINTMKYYYPFLPRPQNRLNAWKNIAHRPSLLRRIKHFVKFRNLRIPRIDLESSGGHQARFEGMNPYPVDFKMRHYILLSMEHAVRKWVNIDYDDKQDWRSNAKNLNFFVPSQTDLKLYTCDDELDPSDPKNKHIFYANK